MTVGHAADVYLHKFKGSAALKPGSKDHCELMLDFKWAVLAGVIAKIMRLTCILRVDRSPIGNSAQQTGYQNKKEIDANNRFKVVIRVKQHVSPAHIAVGYKNNYHRPNEPSAGRSSGGGVPPSTTPRIPARSETETIQK
jgi:hypothetical protein